MSTVKYTPIESKEFPGWYEIPGYSGYLANRNGHILNKKTKNFSVGGRAGRYLKVSAYKDGLNKPSLYYVHDLVCRAFNGPPLDNQVVLHKDNTRHNNTPANLSWGSQSENILQVYKDGLKYSKRYMVSNESRPTWYTWSTGNLVSSLEDFDYVSVNSSNIYNVGYDRKEKRLEVEFKNNSVYQYEDVDPDVFEDLIYAPSVGRYFHDNIKYNYVYSRIS